MLPLKIALRYLLSRKSHAAVNIISAISMAGVAVATAAIVIVLSVFNGFGDLSASHFRVVDPDLLITPAEGKVFQHADSLAERLEQLPQVATAMPSLSERALIVDDQRQYGVTFHGVTERYPAVVDIDSAIFAGEFATEMRDGRPALTASIGVAYNLDLRPGISSVAIYLPRRVGRFNPANPSAAFFSEQFGVSGVVRIDHVDYDGATVIIPLSSARLLLDYYHGEASAIQVRAAGSVSEAKAAVAKALGSDFSVATRDGQHPEAFRMIAVEKWVTFAMLIFILIIATFNIISTLSLLVIEKRDNMHTLRCLGAPLTFVRRIFMIQGALITLAGGVAGIILGVGLSLAQQYGGFITLNGDPSQMTITTYPVRVAPADILAVLAIIALISLLTAQITRLFTRNLN